MKMDFMGMKQGRKLGAAGVMLGMLAIGTFTVPVQAAPAAATLAIGSVNLPRIQAGYSKAADMQKQIEELNTRLQAQFNIQQNGVMLNKTELARLGTLVSKSPRTDAETAELTNLQQKAARDAQELTTLQQKPSPTDADKARLTTLTTQAQAGQQALQEISDGYRAQAQAEQERLSVQLSDQIKAAITAVAVQRGLAVVFDGQLAIYTANDITDDVLKRLNGH